jgi:acetyl-CoA carboxylase carboxyltransferase component
MALKLLRPCFTDCGCHQVREAGGAKAVERHTSRGKLLARQRIDQVKQP